MSEKLILSGLTMAFGGLVALDSMDLEVPFDRVTGVIGPNGAGKTTLFNVISGIYKPTAGTINFCGEELGGLAPNLVSRKGLIRTFQHPRLFKDMTVLENMKVGFHTQTSSNLLDILTFSKKMRHEDEEFYDQAPKLLELVDLHGKLHEKAANLSYGEQRRVEIARALALSPKLLLLDEPLAGLGEKEIDDVVEAIRMIRSRSIGVVLIEHHVGTVMSISDHIMVMNFGKKIAEGPPEQVRTDPVVVEAYLGGEVD